MLKREAVETQTETRRLTLDPGTDISPLSLFPTIQHAAS
jgi:hypothetical protein